MLFAVIDTNVLVSALISPHPDSATVKVMRKVFEGSIIPVYSQKIIAEYSGVLSRAKFRKYFNPRTAAVLIQSITDNGSACSGILYFLSYDGRVDISEGIHFFILS